MLLCCYFEDNDLLLVKKLVMLYLCFVVYVVCGYFGYGL